MKTQLLLLALFIAGGQSLLAQVDTGRPAGGTPYDRYHGPVRQVYARSGSASLSIDEVRAQLRTGRRYRYYFNAAEPYVPQAPEVTESRQQGDCKAKALWLASKMLDRNARYVVGKAKPGDKMSHAWLLWSNGGTWLFLDPTFEFDIVDAGRVAGRKLIMQYSFAGSTSYVHPTYSQFVK
jgi:hypothetical protein